MDENNKEDEYNEDFENLSDHNEDNFDEELKGIELHDDNLDNLEELEKELLDFQENVVPKIQNSTPTSIFPLLNKNNFLKKDKNADISKKIQKLPPKVPEKEKNPISKPNSIKKTEESKVNKENKENKENTNYSRQNSIGSNLSNKNIATPHKEKGSVIRSHSSRSRQEDIIFSKEPNPYTLKVESLLQSKNYDKLSNQQIIQENNLLRLHLKNFNNELNVIIERQALKSNKKTNAAQFINKPASAKARTMIEEIKNNEKKLNLLREEFHRFSNRLQSISDGSYLINLQMKIDETKKSLDDQKKSNKEILLDQKKHGKNLDSLEQAGMPEKLAKGVEISTLLPGLSRRNQKLRERNDLVMIQTEELEKKNQLIQERYDKAIQLAEAYKLFKNDKKREQYEITQAKVEGHEKNIQVLKKKNEKVLEMHKKTMDEFHKNLKEKDEMISTKEKDLLIQRQKIEELMLTEKINKDALMKIMPPTPKSNIIHSSLETPKEDDPKSEENRDWMKEKEEIKLKQELHDYINKTIEIPQNDNDKAKENEKIHDSNQEILNNNSSQKKFYDLQNNKKNEESAKSINVNKEKEDKTLNKNNSHSHMRQEEQARNFNLNNKKGSIGQNIDKKPVEQEVKSTKDEDQLKNNNINKSPEHEEPKDFNLAKKSEEDQQQNLLNLSKNSEQEQPKSFNFSKNSEQEKPKSFNFSKKKVEETTNFIKPAELTNNMNNQFKPLENQKNNQNAFKKEKKIDLFNDSGDAKDFSNIPEIKTIDNNDQSIKNNTNTSNKSIKNNSNKLNNNETTNLSSNIQPITTTKPKKIIADPFEEKLKTENFDNEFVDDIETIQPKKLKMGGGIKAEKKADYVSKAENGDNDFFADL